MRYAKSAETSAEKQRLEGGIGIDLQPVAEFFVSPVMPIGHDVSMETSSQGIIVTVRRNLLRMFAGTGLVDIVGPDIIEAGLEDLELGLGQLLADVEKASRRGVRLSTAVHTHEQFPYLARFHGLLADSLLGQVP